MTRPGGSVYPGLAAALDVDAVRHMLRKALPEFQDGIELRGCTVLDVRYRPGGPCWILYRLKLRDERGRSRRQLLSARLLQSGEAPEPAPPALLERYRSLEDKLLCTPTAVLAQVPMAVYAFPLDAALPGLFDAVDPAAMKRHLARMYAPRKARVRTVNVQPLGYTPQARAAFLYEVLAEDKRTGVPELRRLIGKTHAKKQAARLFADAWATWRAGGERIGLAPPVGYIAAAGLTLQEQVRGQRLGGLVTAPQFVKWVRRTARLLAHLHELSLPLATRRKAADEVQGVHRWAGVLTAIRPELAARVERLRDRLAAEIEARAHLSAPIHADFHHTNVLVDEDRVTIIDLDEMAFGDPMVDVGRFLASLRVPSRRAFGDIRGLESAGEAFLDVYLTQAGGDPKRARLFEAASLLIAAGSSFRIQRRNWEQEVALLVEEAERVLARALAGASAAAGNGAARPSLSTDEQSRWVADPIYMQAALDPHVRALYGADVTRCRVRGRAEGQAPSYELRGWRGDEAWSTTLRGVRLESGGRSLAQALEALEAELEAVPDAPRLPRPVAYLRPLSLLVWELPDGTPLSQLLEQGDAGNMAEAAERLARALAAVHAAAVELEKERGLDDELRRLRKRHSALADGQPTFAAACAPLLVEIERRYASVASRRAPVLGTVHPHHVLCHDGRVGLGKIEEIALAHPFIDAGDFLARLTLLGLRRARLAGALDVADRFRRAYSVASEGEADGLPGFEAAALLRLALTLVERESDVEIAQRLLGQARERLAS